MSLLMRLVNLLYDDNRLHLVEEIHSLQNVRSNLISIYNKVLYNKKVSEEEINYITQIEECQQSPEFISTVSLKPPMVIHVEEGYIDGELARIVFETDTKKPLELLIEERSKLPIDNS